MGESDPELFHAGLLRLAGAQDRYGNASNAALLYQTLSQLADGETSDLAKRRLEVLQGGGSIGDRTEFLFSRFVHELSDPAPLFAMGAAGIAYRAVRGATLARILASTEGTFTRGAVARTLAGLAGFGAEVPTFIAASRAMNVALGQKMDWSSGALTRELAQNVLFLGAIKTAGFGGRSLQRSLNAGPRAGAALGQASLFTGILAGQTLEEAAGFRPSRGGATALVDSLATMISFNAAGRLSRSVLGSRFVAWEKELDFRSESLNQGGPRFLAPNLNFAAATTGAEAEPTLIARGYLPNIVAMTNGSPRGNLPRLPRPISSSSYPPPRSSDFFPTRQGTGLVKVNPPPEQIGEILDLLLPSRSNDPQALTRAGRMLDWLMPEDRTALIRFALESATPESVADRLTAMATQSQSRGAAVHSLRLLFILQSGEKPISQPMMAKALEQVGAVLAPDTDHASSSRWKVAENRLLHTLDAGDLDITGKRRNLRFEMELSRLAKNGSFDPFLDALLYFSLEVRGPKMRRMLANSAIEAALGSIDAKNPIRDFMVGYYLVGRLAETGNLTQALSASRTIQLRSVHWSNSTFPKEYQHFLRSRLKFQEKVIEKFSKILTEAQPEAMQDYYEVKARFGDRHLPEPWGVIWTLRDHASMLYSQKGQLTMSAMVRLQAAENLMRDMVLDPEISKALHASPVLASSRKLLLDLAEDLPARARIESGEPLQAIFNALATRQEWGEAYRLLDAVYHLQIADPMVLRQVHASLLMSLDVAQHRADGTANYDVLASQMKRFAEFEARFF
ncbi:MAG TPA: hypothetical protein VJP40_06465 [bacterium]|nr:hypothetical protein [bacterium]